MNVVLEARDEKPERTVAIKVLPARAGGVTAGVRRNRANDRS